MNDLKSRMRRRKLRAIGEKIVIWWMILVFIISPIAMIAMGYEIWLLKEKGNINGNW